MQLRRHQDRTRRADTRVTNTSSDKSMKIKNLRYSLPIMLCLQFTGCGSLTPADTKLAVEIGGVNYSDQPITYALTDPGNPESGAGEPVDPFGAGGVMCCFLLPNEWQPGIKVRIQIFDTRRKPVRDDIVDLPPYVDGKPGRLWAVHYQDGSVDVFSSENGPPHAKWPGKVKGWPVPSIEYRRARWVVFLEDKKSAVRAAEELIKELQENPVKNLKERWEFDKQHSMEKIEAFSGPDDPKYATSVVKRNEEFLKSAQERLDEWIKRKP